MVRILLSAGNIFVSLVLGALAFGFVFIKYPEAMATILDWAADLKAWIISRGVATEYNNWMRVLLEERQLVFMGFTILMRIGLSIIVYPFALLWERRASARGSSPDAPCVHGGALRRPALHGRACARVSSLGNSLVSPNPFWP